MSLFWREGHQLKNDFKLVAKYAFSQAPSYLKNRLAGSGGILGPGCTLYIFFDTGLLFLQGAHLQSMKELITEDLSCAQLRWIDQTLRNTSNSLLKLSESLEIHCNKMTQWRFINSSREIITTEKSMICIYQRWSFRNNWRHIW